MIKTILLASILLISCVPKEELDKNTVTIAVAGEPVNLDPEAPLDGYSLQIRAQIYEPLMVRNSEGQFEGVLAIQWEFINDKKIRIKLKKNVTFHNGDPFTSKDVKYTIQRQQKSIANSELYQFIESVDTPDDYTVILNLNTTFAAAFAHLSLPNLQIVNQRSIEVDEFIGTGPYQLTEWLRGNQVKLNAYENYHRGRSAINQLVFRTIPEESSRFVALETGDIQIARDIFDTDINIITNNPNLELLTIATPNVEYLSINTKKGILTNLILRKALSMAIDRDGIINAAYGGNAVEAAALAPYNIVSFNKKLTNIYDPLAAKKIVTDLGFSGYELTLYTISGVRARVAEIIQSDFRDIGINLSVHILELGAFLQFIKKDDFDLYLLNWTTLTSDGDFALTALIQSEGSWNNTQYASAEIDQLLLDAKKELDVDKRNAMYMMIQEIIQGDIPYIPLFSKRVQNVKIKELQNITSVGGSAELYLGELQYKE